MLLVQCSVTEGCEWPACPETCPGRRKGELIQKQRCLVSGCQNHYGDGQFIGELCSSCYEMLKTGVVGHGTSFVHEIAKATLLTTSVATVHLGSSLRDIGSALRDIRNLRDCLIKNVKIS